jgi:hypothetical protein
MRQQNTNFAKKYKHYFFYNRQKKNLIFEGKLDEENQSLKYCEKVIVTQETRK